MLLIFMPVVINPINSFYSWRMWHVNKRVELGITANLLTQKLKVKVIDLDCKDLLRESYIASQPGDGWTEHNTEPRAGAEALRTAHVQSLLLHIWIQMEQLLHRAHIEEMGKEGGVKFSLSLGSQCQGHLQRTAVRAILETFTWSFQETEALLCQRAGATRKDKSFLMQLGDHQSLVPAWQVENLCPISASILDKWNPLLTPPRLEIDKRFMDQKRTMNTGANWP